MKSTIQSAFIKAGAIGFMMIATHAAAQVNYVGRFDYYGGTEGGYRSSDLPLLTQSYVSRFAVDVVGNCSAGAQILHTSGLRVPPTKLISKSYSPIQGNAVRYLFSVNNDRGFPVVGIRGFLNGYPGAVCSAFVYIDSMPAVTH